MKIRKLAQGGDSMFNVYTPTGYVSPYDKEDPVLYYLKQSMVAGLSNKKTSSTSSKTKTQTEFEQAKEVLDLLKGMKGLDNDVQEVITTLKRQSLKESILGKTSGDLISDYYTNLLMLNKVNRSKEKYDKAYENISKKDGLGEYAVTSDGGVMVRDESNKIQKITPESYYKNPKKYRLLTNQDLLYIREHDAKMSFQDSLLNVVFNGTSEKEISDYIKSVIEKISSTKSSVEGLTVEQNNKFLQGINVLKEAALKTGGRSSDLIPAIDGVYKVKLESESQLQQAKYAIEVLYNRLPKNFRTLLKLKSGGTEQGVKETIADIVMSGVSSTNNFTIDFNKDLTEREFGKTESSKGSDGSGSSKLELDSALALAIGEGYEDNIVLNPGTKYQVQGLGVYNEFVKSGASIGSNSSLQDATTSEVAHQLDWDKAVMGNSRLKTSEFDRVLLKTGSFVALDLPINAKVQQETGLQVPDFSKLQAYYEVSQEIKNSKIKSPVQINIICKKKGLPNLVDGNGNINRQSYARFAAVQGFAPESAFANPENVVWKDPVLKEADDDSRESFERQIQKMNKDSKYSLHNGIRTPIGDFFRDNLVEGTIFVPIRTGIMASTIAGKNHLKLPFRYAAELSEEEKQRKLSTYKNPGPLQ